MPLSNSAGRDAVPISTNPTVPSQVGLTVLVGIFGQKGGLLESILVVLMNLEPVIQSEVSQKEKNKYRILMCVCVCVCVCVYIYV